MLNSSFGDPSHLGTSDFSSFEEKDSGDKHDPNDSALHVQMSIKEDKGVNNKRIKFSIVGHFPVVYPLTV